MGQPEYMTITNAQIRAIKTGQRALGMDDDTYRDMLLEHFNVSSCTQLTRMQAGKAIELLRGFGWQEQRRVPRKPPRRRPGKSEGVLRLVTARELEKIGVLTGLIKWRYKNGFSLWMKKRLHITRVRTDEDAFKVIEGLKKMFENGMKKQHGHEWWRMDFNDPDIMDYIELHCPERYR